MASTFTVTEEDLFNFEAFCDLKYSDPNCQKYGFFKVKLDTACDGQCSSLDDFFAQFGVQSQLNIKTAILAKNPNDKNLFGFHYVRPKESEMRDFVTTTYEASSFQDVQDSPTCCMRVLEEDGVDALLHHFYTTVTSNAIKGPSNRPDDRAAIRVRAVSKKVAFEKRQSYKNATSMEGKKRCLEMAMLSEKIIQPHQSKCGCDACSEKFSWRKKTQASRDMAGVGFPYCPGIEETQNNFLYLTHNFAMAHLCFKNMLSDLDSIFGGVSYPGLYLGGLHSTFPLHTEDLSCWSFNFLLHGFPKFWIIVPSTHASRLTDALHRRGFFGLHRWCRNVLNHKFYIPTHLFLEQENIPYEVVIQRKGEGIVVLPNSPHTGGSLGPSLAEACNLGTNKWIPYGCVAPNCPCVKDAVHADLSDLIALHEPSLLHAYINNSVVDFIDDEHFQKSIVNPKRDCDFTHSHGLVPTQPGNFSNKMKSQSERARIKCPVCKVSWSCVQKKHMITHLLKYHSNKMEEDSVTAFMSKYALSK